MSTKLPHGLCSRRHFIEAGGFGLGMLGLATLLRQDGLLAAPIKPLLGNETFDLLPKQPPRPAKAKAMISLFMMGGPSQMDLFDHKPMLTKWHGQKFPGDNLKYDNVAQASAKVLGSFWKFSRHGKCGMELSELLPQLGTVADDICLIRSMKSGVNNHLQAMLAMQTGRITSGNPTMGAWATYALGSETKDLPAYVVMGHPSGLPTFANQHWSNGWLPSIYQGTFVRATAPHILNLDPPAALQGKPQERQMELLRAMNAEHAANHPGETDLQARIQSQGGLRHLLRTEARARTLRHRPQGVRRLRPPLPHRPPAHRARRALRAGPQPRPELGQPRLDQVRPAHPLRCHRPPERRARRRP
jgi:hypothetical protein